MSHQDAKSRSFKINVKINDKDKLMSSDFWPDGIACRLFYETQTQTQTDSDSDRILFNINRNHVNYIRLQKSTWW